VTSRDDDRLTRELRRLALPSAPPTLVSRVMLAVNALDRRPWYARAWVTWPEPLRIASAFVVLALAVTAWWFAPAIWDLRPEWARSVAALSRVLNSLIAPLVLYVGGLAILISLCCAAVWAAVNRVALGGAHSS
jgi:hypothetical protein